MLTMYELYARERTRALTESSEQHRLASQFTTGRRWFRRRTRDSRESYTLAG